MSETNDTPILDDSPVWNDEVPRIEARQKLTGGIDGNLNTAPRVLAQRTRWLKNQITTAVQQANDGLAAHEAAADPHGDRAYAQQMVGDAIDAEAAARQAADNNLQAQINTKLGTDTTTDEVAEGANNLYFSAQRVRDVVLTGLSLAVKTAITAADPLITAFGKIQAQINDLLTRVGELEAGGGGGGGGTISADTVIEYPGAYADWAALIADLKSNVYTGTVTVNVAAGTYTEPFDFGTDLNMPNLHVVFDAAAQVDTTGWAPNFAIYVITVFGTRTTIGSVSGTLTKVAGDAGSPVFGMGGNGFNVGFGTSDGLLPAAGGTMTNMTFAGFEAGVSFVNSVLTGHGKLVMTGLTTGQNLGFNGFGCLLRGVEVELDGDLVKVGGALTSSVADGSPCGSFRGITFTGTRGVPRCAVVWEGTVDLGLVSNTGTDEWYVAATANGTGSARIAADSVFDQTTDGTSPFTSVLGASLQVALQGEITWKPKSVNSRLSYGDGHLDISAIGSGIVHVDNSGGITPDFVFGHQYGAVRFITVDGNYGFVHQFGANKYTDVSLVWNAGVSPTQVSGAGTGSTVKVDPSVTTLYHQEAALIDSLTVDLNYLAADQEFTLLSYYGVTNLAFTQVVTNAPAGLAANVPVRLKKMNGNWFAM